MIYRPQFAFSGTPQGFRDEQFHYSFDSEDIPVLGTPIAAGAFIGNIVLQLQNDAEFILRSIKVELDAGPSNLFGIIRDPYGNYLSAVPLPFAGYLTGSGAESLGYLVVPYESEIHAPIGGFFELFLYNETANPVTPPAFTLYGVNRRECVRAA